MVSPTAARLLQEADYSPCVESLFDDAPIKNGRRRSHLSCDSDTACAVSLRTGERKTMINIYQSLPWLPRWPSALRRRHSLRRSTRATGPAACRLSLISRAAASRPTNRARALSEAPAGPSLRSVSKSLPAARTRRVPGCKVSTPTTASTITPVLRLLADGIRIRRRPPAAAARVTTKWSSPTNGVDENAAGVARRVSAFRFAVPFCK